MENVNESFYGRERQKKQLDAFFMANIRNLHSCMAGGELEKLNS